MALKSLLVAVAATTLVAGAAFANEAVKEEAATSMEAAGAKVEAKKEAKEAAKEAKKEAKEAAKAEPAAKAEKKAEEKAAH